MATCTYEPWSMQELSDALKNMHKDNKKIVVPMFQRGKRWKVNQESDFIDSLKKGYPVGTMLFYKKVEENQEVYMLVDGLQRGNTIKKYLSEPTKYFSKEYIVGETVTNIFNVLGIKGQEQIIKSTISKYIVGKIQKYNNLDDVEAYEVAKGILKELPTTTEDAVDKVFEILKPIIKSYKDNYREVSKRTIPVIVYCGSEDDLQDIFERINSKGTPLTQYEVYAASWPINKKFKINNNNIIDKILKKYDSLADDEYEVYGYNRNELRVNKMVNSFEYLFGLSKHLNEDFKFLNFSKNEEDDEINTMGFELVNACINEGREGIKTLYRQILKLNVVEFEKRLMETIEFVGRVIAPINKFKGNSRKTKMTLYPKFLILAMIASTFRQKYDINNLMVSRKSWNENKVLLEENMLKNFVYDILTDEWNNGGTNKIYTAAKSNKFSKKISKDSWDIALNSFFEREKNRNEKAKISSVSGADLVFLNCIYLSTFTAMDQLSLKKFDVEYIAPKEQMKKLINTCKSEGLPISCIGNCCYLPDYINRSKKDKNFYQDKKYSGKVNLSEIEGKYSFTKEKDLEWMDLPYQEGDIDILKEYYFKYLKNRFAIQKEKFYEAMKIL